MCSGRLVRPSPPFGSCIFQCRADYINPFSLTGQGATVSNHLALLPFGIVVGHLRNQRLIPDTCCVPYGVKNSIYVHGSLFFSAECLPPIRGFPCMSYRPSPANCSAFVGHTGNVVEFGSPCFWHKAINHCMQLVVGWVGPFQIIGCIVGFITVNVIQLFPFHES